MGCFRPIGGYEEPLKERQQRLYASWATEGDPKSRHQAGLRNFGCCQMCLYWRRVGTATFGAVLLCPSEGAVLM